MLTVITTLSMLKTGVMIYVAVLRAELLCLALRSNF